METCSERRKRKLIALASEKGGTATIAKDCGLNPATLDQIVKGVLLPAKTDGTRSERALGDDAARMIEARYGLERGWFDSDEVTGLISESDAIEVALEVLTKALQKADKNTRIALEPLLASMANEPEDAAQKSQLILRLLVTDHQADEAAHDDRPTAGRSGVLIGGSAFRQLGDTDGSSNRHASKGAAKR